MAADPPASVPPRSRRVERISRRWSLRLRVIGVIVLVGLAPQLLVFAWSQIDRPVPGRLWGRARDATNDAGSALARLPLEQASEALAQVARGRSVRLRVLDARARTVFDVDADGAAEPFNRVDAFFFDLSRVTLGELDEEEGPLAERPGLAAARSRGGYIECQWESIGYCESIRPVSDVRGESLFVYVQATSQRAVSGVYELRRQVLKLGLVTVPFALLLAIYAGRRLVRPIETLRRQALAHAKAAGPGLALDLRSRDEVGALADAFNALLQELERKRTDNEAFVADLVHELKNPVAAVRVVADTLVGGGLEPARAERMARVLRDSSTKLDRVVTQFLELARAEAGLPNEERSVLDLAQLVRARVAGLRDDPRHAGLTLGFSAGRGSEGEGEVGRGASSEGGSEARVVGVASRLESVFAELLENACSFAGEGGRVTAGVQREGDEVVVTVTDSGPGIAAEDLPRVFARFFTTRGGARGTGLGLALVEAVAHAHGGRVAVRSPPGAGATFEVRLPAEPRESRGGADGGKG